MFKDLSLSRDMMRDFHNSLSAESAGRSLTAMVLQRSAWPFAVPKTTIDLLPQVRSAALSRSLIYSPGIPFLLFTLCYMTQLHLHMCVSCADARGPADIHRLLQEETPRSYFELGPRVRHCDIERALRPRSQGAIRQFVSGYHTADVQRCRRDILRGYKGANTIRSVFCYRFTRPRTYPTIKQLSACLTVSLTQRTRS